MNAQEIIAEVAHVTGVTYDEIKGSRRHRSTVRARFLAVWALRQLRQWWKLQDLALAIGVKDHVTIMHALKRVRELAVTEPEFAEMRIRVADRLNIHPQQVEA